LPQGLRKCRCLLPPGGSPVADGSIPKLTSYWYSGDALERGPHWAPIADPV